MIGMRAQEGLPKPRLVGHNLPAGMIRCGVGDSEYSYGNAR
jgi:hypothetical protein